MGEGHRHGGQRTTLWTQSSPSVSVGLQDWTQSPGLSTMSSPCKYLSHGFCTPYRTKAWWAGLLCEKPALDLHPDSSSAGKWWQVSHLRSLDYRATVAVRALWALWLELPCSSHSVVYTELAIAALGFHLWPPQSLWWTYGILLVSQCG